LDYFLKQGSSLWFLRYCKKMYLSSPHVYQVPEILPEEVLGKMSAPPKSDVPIITPSELAEADGFVFGFPTRFGMMAAQFKAFLDATGGLWKTQQLAGKPAGIFFSTGSQGGGQETTA
jgi:NAD(P)H dehydrogenase (quinone)